jgi:hypothetical protein
MTQPRKFYFFVVLTAVFAVFLLLPGRAAAQSATVTDDATTQLSSPTTNNGSSSNLGLQGPNLQESYIRFDLSVLPSGLQASNISKATLRLFLSNVSAGGAFDVRYAAGIWNEKTLTYNNAPPAGLLIAASIPANYIPGAGLCAGGRHLSRAGVVERNSQQRHRAPRQPGQPDFGQFR